jgi:hypothetical protein
MAHGPVLSARVFPWLRENSLDGPPAQARDEWVELGTEAQVSLPFLFYFLFFHDLFFLSI